jgi:hypothetical protein
MSEHSSRDSSRDRSLNKKDKNDKKISKKPPATSSPKVPVFIQGTGFTRKNYPTAFLLAAFRIQDSTHVRISDPKQIPAYHNYK